MRCGIALGSNLGDRMENLRRAREALAALHQGGEPMLCSRVWETEPVDCPPGAAPYLNAAVEIEFAGDPATLLEALQAIERKSGRPDTRPRNAPRTLDLDALYAGDTVLESGEILLPHPRMHLRRFVLIPLRDIRPELVSDLIQCAPAADVKLYSDHPQWK